MENNQMAKGISTTLLTYFLENPGKIITVDTLMKALGYDRRQVFSNMYNVRQKGAGANIEMLQRGTWRYVEKDTSEEAEGTFTVTVLKETDEAYIVLDTSGNVYKMFLLG